MPKKEIRVSATTTPEQLGRSIAACWQEGFDITLSAIGPAPVSKCVYGVCAANRILAPKGTLLFLFPALVDRVIEDKRTGLDVAWVVTLLQLRNVMDSIPERDLEEYLEVAEDQPDETANDPYG
jgi:stage V sporulation protein SpoVS